MKGRGERPQTTRHARLRFALIFGGVSGALLALYSFPYAEHGISEALFQRYLELYARLAGFFLQLADSAVHVEGADIVGRTSLTVAKNCDAMDVIILFAAAVVAFPAPWRRRALGLAAGTLLLGMVNVARIVSLYYVNVHRPQSFELVHAEVWPFVIVMLAVGAFLGWARWAGEPAPGVA